MSRQRVSQEHRDEMRWALEVLAAAVRQDQRFENQPDSIRRFFVILALDDKI